MTSRATRHIKTIAGENIKAARELDGLTQRQLAAGLGLDVGAVSRWERGAVMPTHENIVRLAQTFQQSPEWFYIDHAQEAAA